MSQKSHKITGDSPETQFADKLQIGEVRLWINNKAVVNGI